MAQTIYLVASRLSDRYFSRQTIGAQPHPHYGFIYLIKAAATVVSSDICH